MKRALLAALLFSATACLAQSTVSSSGSVVIGGGGSSTPPGTTVNSIAAQSHKFVNSFSSVSGNFTAVQPASTDLSDAASLASLTNSSAQTFTGPVSTPTLTTGVTNGTLFNCSNTALYPGADPSIQMNACTTAAIAAGGGTLDFRSFTGTYNMSQQINIGSPTSGYPKLIGLSYLFPPKGTWKFGITDGTSCGIMQYGSTNIIGEGTGNLGNRLIVDTRTDVTGQAMQGMYCTDPAPTGTSSYIKASNIFFKNSGGATFTDGLIAIRHIYDGGQWDGISGGNPTGDVAHIYDICCHANFTRLGLASAYTANGGTTLTLGKAGSGTVAVDFDHLTLNNPGIGKNSLLVQGGSQTNGINFINLYEEGNGSVDSTTPVNQLNSNYGINFIGGTVNTSLSGPDQTTKAAFANSGASFNVYGMSVYNTSLCITDTSAGSGNYPCTQGSGVVRMIQNYQGGSLSRTHFQNFDATNISAPNILGNETLAALGVPGNGSISAKTTGGTLPDSTTYYYRVAAVNAAGISSPNTEVSATTTTPGGTSSISLSWAWVYGATGYNIYRGTTSGGELLLTNVSGLNTLSYIDTGALTPAGALPTSNLSYGSAIYQSNGGLIFKDSTGTQRGSDSSGIASRLLYKSPHVTITTGATPVIALASGENQTIQLSANATPTITGIADGAHLHIQICQPSTGGPYTWTWPSAIHGGMTIGTTASTCSTQTFTSYTGSTLIPDSAGVTNVAP